MLIDSPASSLWGPAGGCPHHRAAQILACRWWTGSSWTYRRGPALVTSM